MTPDACARELPYLADAESFNAHALWAKDSGKEVLIADDFHLFLDLDFKLESTLSIMFDGKSHSKQREILENVLVNNQVLITSMEFTRSSSGNIHGILTLDHALIEPVRIALEIALGSDPKRGALNALRYSFGLRGVSRLFRPLPLVRIEL